MKKTFFLMLIALAGISLGLWSVSKTTGAAEDLIRFHVVANSDSAVDQEVKLKVRDAILADFAEELQQIGNYQEAYAFLKSHQNEMVTIANNTLKTYGFSYSSEVDIGTDEFPTKNYGKLVLPAGEYEAVKVILGEGQGKNWWCVMFPPLCFVDISKNLGVARLEGNTLPGESDVVAANSGLTSIEIKSKVLEIIK